jgi:hypothetical protein
METISISKEQQIIIDKQLKKMQRVEFVKKYGAVIMLVLLFCCNSLFTKNFFTLQTMYNLVVQSTPVVLVSLGMTFVIATGGIDISTGACMAMCGMVTTMTMQYLGIPGGVLVGLIAKWRCRSIFRDSADDRYAGDDDRRQRTSADTDSGWTVLFYEQRLRRIIIKICCRNTDSILLYTCSGSDFRIRSKKDIVRQTYRSDRR